MQGFERRIVYKVHPGQPLGISLAPEYLHHSIIVSTRPGGLGARILGEGDRIISVNGVTCYAPTETARKLRAASGQVELRVIRGDAVDFEALIRADALAQARVEGAAAEE